MYDAWAGYYEFEFQTMKNYIAPRTLVRQFSETCNITKPGLKILDVGIGTGMLADWFKVVNPDCRITGVDLSPKMLSICALKGITEDLIEQDVQEDGLPFEDGTFDLVVSSGVFELFDYPERVITEMGRVLKDGGGLSFTSYADSPEEYGCNHHEEDLILDALSKASVFLNEQFYFHAFNHGRENDNQINYHLYSGVKESTPFIVPE